MNPVKDATSLLELRRLLRLYKPDITLGYYIKPVIYGTIAAWLAGVPRRYAMIEGLGFAFTEGQRPSWRRASLQRIVAKLRSEEHTSELQSLMRISYAVFCLKKKKKEKT